MRTRLLSDITYILGVYIRDDFPYYLEDYGFNDRSLLGPDPDPDEMTVEAETVLYALPDACLYQGCGLKWDEDAYSQLQQEVLESFDHSDRFAAWCEADLGVTTDEVISLISELLCVPSITDIAAEGILCYALDNGLANLLPTDNSAESVLKLEHLYWLWFSANDFKLLGQTVA